MTISLPIIGLRGQRGAALLPRCWDCELVTAYVKMQRSVDSRISCHVSSLTILGLGRRSLAVLWSGLLGPRGEEEAWPTCSLLESRKSGPLRKLMLDSRPISGCRGCCYRSVGRVLKSSAKGRRLPCILAWYRGSGLANLRRGWNVEYSSHSPEHRLGFAMYRSLRARERSLAMLTLSYHHLLLQTPMEFLTRKLGLDLRLHKSRFKQRYSITRQRSMVRPRLDNLHSAASKLLFPRRRHVRHRGLGTRSRRSWDIRSAKQLYPDPRGVCMVCHASQCAFARRIHMAVLDEERMVVLDRRLWP